MNDTDHGAALRPKRTTNYRLTLSTIGPGFHDPDEITDPEFPNTQAPHDLAPLPVAEFCRYCDSLTESQAVILNSHLEFPCDVDHPHVPMPKGRDGKPRPCGCNGCVRRNTEIVKRQVGRPAITCGSPKCKQRLRRDQKRAERAKAKLSRLLPI